MEAALITSVLTLIGLLLKIWVANQPKRDQEAKDAEIQRTRAAIATGDDATVNTTLDGLLSGGGMPTEGTASDSATGQHSDTDTAKRINDVLGA